MTKLCALMRIIIFCVSVILISFSASGRNVTVRGVVRDSLTREPIPYASVLLKGTDRGVLTDDNGRYTIVTTLPFDSVMASSLGYTTKAVASRKRGDNVQVDIDLVSTGVLLGEVIAKPKREHYSKKNNPAVAFMEKIRHTQDLNDPRRHDNYNYNKYERITLALNDYQFNDSAKRGFDKMFSFVKEYIDTSEVSGKPILNVALREKLSSVHYRKEPKGEKEFVTGLRSSGIDEMLDKQSMQTFYEDVLREVDVYDNDIVLMQTRFVSPLSRIAPDFYKFYLTDTVFVDTTRCVELTFVPRNPSTMGFTGRFYVPVGDTTMFIKRIVLRVPHDINLNFINGLVISQDYEKAPDGSRLKTKDDMILEASVVPGSGGLYGRRQTVYDSHNFDPAPDASIFKRGVAQIYAPGAEYRGQDFWDENRKAEIAQGVNGIEKMMERMRQVPLFYWTEKVVKVLVSGYVPTAKKSYFDIGPMTSLVSYNSVEGLRLRAGGMTTANLSRRWFARGYGAYGFRDHKWKYKAELEYSFRDKNYHSREFPIHSLRATQLYDLDRLGQISSVHNADNFFLSVSRLPDRQMTYHRVSKLEYILETEQHFSLEARIQQERQYSTPFMTFVNGYGENFRHYTMNSFRLQLRYAPGEKFYQLTTGRTRINFDAPEMVISHTYAPKGFMGNPFALNVTEASFFKRIWLSAFGYVDMTLKGGHVWSRTPYPGLLIPGANLSYLIIPDLFSCMNPMEFINDSYAQWDLTYWANGLILNYIPIIKRLKLREAFMFKGVWGHLSDRNKPWLNPDLYGFPEINNTQLMSDTPYMEVGVGLDNLLKVFRVDYTWRLTYRDNPGACKQGLRFTFHFSF
ncbi:carboxypeptidase-like regulatory domain-containing protein [Muribaculaceae bacterium Isolate-039 (Harlan)]|jgi:hypothetical protein|uniref:DUF5686 and carboxypeptidase-like regulatory domain-containing protein n=2 Tax=Duncaniella muris TaxID=2094150 RepID=UPI000AA2E45B|nr:DUF5686 and carboxypeptidase-like regulatory domain-containing protein [Duncaniella muris]ROS91748.1 carboxypeptidase-like regulatory domain-containing protein [Muribaculaceae bacterium Isolate-039 (Harlan)]ROS95751.1 carboxypeptidase-like regulatory domain-containing protein [Muribaculaceae bacterium Isolate-077 (Janvier)]ROS97565.1 carboxypeptidase-like regulatory domain-containing protein [Muribaculaceae bacterium Isolate-083 (Janvier)]ROS99179.1 carboxypeptidase-like regulatory domain-co